MIALMRAAVKAEVDPLKALITTVVADVATLKGDVATLKADFALLAAASANDRVRRSNGMMAVDGPVTRLLYTHDGKQWPATVAQPSNQMDLAVAGNENVPGSMPPRRSTWNKKMSTDFLRTAVGETYDTDTEGEAVEFTPKARTRRFKVIQCLGVPVERVVAAMQTL